MLPVLPALTDCGVSRRVRIAVWTERCAGYGSPGKTAGLFSALAADFNMPLSNYARTVLGWADADHAETAADATLL
jgi:hypothetical protein